MVIPTQKSVKKVLSPTELEYEIKAKGISVADLAKMGEMNSSTIYRYLNGDIEMGNRKLQRIWEALRGCK
jgi:hypothetical protein